MTNEEITRAVDDFIRTYAPAPPTIPVCPIRRGGQNNNSLPDDSDFIIYTLVSERPVERVLDDFQTNPETEEDGTLTTGHLHYLTYQVDCYGEHSQERIRRLTLIFRGAKGPEFFEKYYDKWGGIGVVSSGQPVNTNTIDGTSNYTGRWTAELTVCATLTVPLPQDWLKELDITLKGVL